MIKYQFIQSKMMGEIILISAIAENGVIGKDGKLPWYLPPDLKHFKELTMGHDVVMGRVTYESIPEQYRPLPGRHNIVLSRNSDYQPHPDVEVMHSIDDVVERSWDSEKIFIAGGEHMYRAFLPIASRAEITQLHHNYSGDAHFPNVNQEEWDLVAQENHKYKDIDFSYLTYQRIE
jgi:dihydrofolate reductase